MKRTSKIILFLTLCFIYTFPAKSVNISSCFVKSTVPITSSTSAEIKITMEDNTIVAKPYECSHPFVSKLLVDEGVLEGIDCGEWGGVVRFSPYNMEPYIKIPRCCPFCGSATLQCCPISKSPVEEKNAYGDVFKGVDRLNFHNTFIYLFSPRNDISMFSLINENCRGFFKVRNKDFAITVSDLMCGAHSKIYEIIHTHSKCESKKIIDIDGCTETFLVVGDDVYIATQTSLFKFKENHLYKLLDFNKNLYPGSIIYSDECLFIGMRAGWMCKYDLKIGKSEWYRYVGPNLSHF